MRDEAGAARGERDDDIEGRAGLAQDANGEKRAANRPDDGVDGVPDRVNPRELYRRKTPARRACPRSKE